MDKVGLTLGVIVIIFLIVMLGIIIGGTTAEFRNAQYVSDMLTQYELQCYKDQKLYCEEVTTDIRNRLSASITKN